MVIFAIAFASCDRLPIHKGVETRCLVIENNEELAPILLASASLREPQYPEGGCFTQNF